ncbi:MAG TPA: flavin reductase family protein [Pseudonocardiaceae bacterium]|nr:flavin reductase family protein [Pseudonocardiaceae bacterium]
MTGNSQFGTGHGEWVEIVPTAFHLPSPVVVLGTVDEAGTPDLSTMSALGVVCIQPALVCIGIKPTRTAYRNIRRDGRFSISVIDTSDLAPADVLGTRKLRLDPDKLERAAVSWAIDDDKLPYVATAPIAMTGEVRSDLGRRELGLDGAPSHRIVIGEITRSMARRDLVRDGEVLMEEISLPIYLNRLYARTSGEVLGIQRFTDDPAVRDEKMRLYGRFRTYDTPASDGSGNPS